MGLPLLVLAFSVARPPALQPPNLPPVFDATAAAAIATEFSLDFPSRIPGTAGSTNAARWLATQLGSYGFPVHAERFTATVPGRGRLQLENLVATRTGLSQKTIVVMAHRDDGGTGPGANDNASGTAALIELARAYAPPSASAVRLNLPYSLVFLSTDAAVAGGLGAAEFAAHSPERQNVIAVVNLDAVAGRGAAAARAGRRHGPLPVGEPRRDGARRAGRADGRRPGAREHAPPARRPRLPVQRRTSRRPSSRAGSRRSRSRPAPTGRRPASATRRGA